MMPRERISFLKAEKHKAKNGEERLEWVLASEFLTNVPTERRKRKHSDNTLNAGEEFIELKITFWVRYNESMNEDLRIVYEGRQYRILDIDRNFHNNSCDITCAKIND